MAASWEQVLQALGRTITRQNFDSYFRDTACVGVDVDGTLVVLAANELAADWLSHRMRNVVDQAVASTLGPGVRVRFLARDSPG